MLKRVIHVVTTVECVVKIERKGCNKYGKTEGKLKKDYW
jgi:hypothetical protein